jgi:hypothetical protein
MQGRIYIKGALFLELSHLYDGIPVKMGIPQVHPGDSR